MNVYLALKYGLFLIRCDIFTTVYLWKKYSVDRTHCKEVFAHENFTLLAIIFSNCVLLARSSQWSKKNCNVWFIEIWTLHKLSYVECPKSLKMFKLDLTWCSRSDWTGTSSQVWTAFWTLTCLSRTWPDLTLKLQVKFFWGSKWGKRCSTSQRFIFPKWILTKFIL